MPKRRSWRLSARAICHSRAHTALRLTPSHRRFSSACSPSQASKRRLRMQSEVRGGRTLRSAAAGGSLCRDAMKPSSPLEYFAIQEALALQASCCLMRSGVHGETPLQSAVAGGSRCRGAMNLCRRPDCLAPPRGITRQCSIRRLSLRTQCGGLRSMRSRALL